MDTVAFINAKSAGSKGDLVLSFAIADEQWAGGIRSLILLRSPEHEWVFEEFERGITVSMEGEEDDGNDLEGRLLVEFALDASAKAIRVKTRRHSYDLDIRKAEAKSVEEMRRLLAKMNFDGKAKMVGL